MVLTNEKLSIIDGKGYESSIKWNEVYSVSCYKLDCITKVHTYLVFNFEYGEYVEVCNDMKGWEQLINHLDTYLPIQDKKWGEYLIECSDYDDKVYF